MRVLGFGKARSNLASRSSVSTSPSCSASITAAGPLQGFFSRRSSTSSARTIVSWKAAKPFIGTTKYWNGLRPPLGRLSGVTSQSLKFETKDAAQANGGLTSTAGEKSTKPFVLPGFASA